MKTLIYTLFVISYSTLIINSIESPIKGEKNGKVETKPWVFDDEEKCHKYEGIFLLRDSEGAVDLLILTPYHNFENKRQPIKFSVMLVTQNLPWEQPEYKQLGHFNVTKQGEFYKTEEKRIEFKAVIFPDKHEPKQHKGIALDNILYYKVSESNGAIFTDKKE